MIIRSAAFIGSFTKTSQCPERKIPEYAFIGRSNVGKSTLINLLCERKALANVSNQPGKTQHLNYYLINDQWHLTDLPGFGYAKISKKKRADWERMINHYLINRKTLGCVFMLVDGSISPQKIDLEFISKLGEMQIPFVIVFTKIDKGKKLKGKAYREQFKNKLLEEWEDLPQFFMSSSIDRTGREEILEFIDSVNKQYEQVISS